MSFWNQYPYTDFHELNLDWIIKKIKEVTKEMNDFKVVNQIVWGGLHDPGKEYPRFCIVDTPTHEGYISIQPAPVGITIDNEDYWRQVANYSALYADFQNRIVALESEVSDINDTLDHLKERRFIVLGDSYLLGYNPNTQQPDYKGWGYYAKQYLNIADDDWYEYGVIGGGFVSVGDLPPNLTFLTALQNHAADITSPETITDIIVGGGINDALHSTIADVAPAILAFSNYCKTVYPNAMITIAYMGSVIGDQAGNYASYTMCHTYKDGAASLTNARYLRGSEFVLRYKALLDTDGGHPTELGDVFLGRCVANFFKGTTPSVGLNYIDTVWGDITCRETQLDNVITFDCTSDIIKPITANGQLDGHTTYALLGTNSSRGYVYGYGNIPTANCFSVSCWVRVGSDVAFTACPANVYVTNNSLYIAPIVIASNGGYAVDSINYIAVPKFSVSFNALLV